MRTESSLVTAQTMEVEQLLDDHIYQDAFNFCNLDLSICGSTVEEFAFNFEMFFRRENVLELNTLDPVIKEGFCSDEFYTQQSQTIMDYQENDFIVAKNNRLRDVYRIVYAGTLQTAP